MTTFLRKPLPKLLEQSIFRLIITMYLFFYIYTLKQLSKFSYEVVSFNHLVKNLNTISEKRSHNCNHN